MRKAVLILVMPVMLLASAGAVFGAAEEQKLPVIMVTDVAGLGDQGFNDAAWAGVKRAAKEFALPIDVIQSRDQADYVANLSAAAERAKVVVSVGFIIADAVKRVAPKYPDTHFIQIEGTVSGPPNVHSYGFKSQEAGFLAGVVAAAYTKTGKVGAVTGMDIPPVEAYAAGYLAGVKAVEAATGRRIEATVLSAGTFDDPVKGKSLADSLISRNCDVVFRIAGNTGVGVWEAVKAAPSVKIIWEDIDRDAVAPGKVLASTLKRVDNAVFQGIQMAVDRTWEAGHDVLGYREGAVGLSKMKDSRSLFSDEGLSMIERAKFLLGRGEVKVPTKRADVTAWLPPDLTAAK
ncbi:MAG: BMP family ABC transporter substrate-binding protein [Planctomycetes bacterium]|nr:BMP family ABC transporter substrate-binding protein [Planctomycetota bacterium]